MNPLIRSFFNFLDNRCMSFVAEKTNSNNTENYQHYSGIYPKPEIRNPLIANAYLNTKSPT